MLEELILTGWNRCYQVSYCGTTSLSNTDPMVIGFAIGVGLAAVGLVIFGKFQRKRVIAH